MIRVLIADDDRLFAEALELILAADDRIQVIGRALDGRQAVELARELAPDVVVMDLSMPGLDGFDATAEILMGDGTPRVLVLTGSADPADLDRAQAAGAWAYLTKENIAEELVPRVLGVQG